MDLKANATDQTVSFAAFNSNTGLAVTVTAGTTNLALWYRCGGAGTKNAINAANLAAINSAHSDGGIIVIAGQEHRLDLPDAAVAGGADFVEWGGTADSIIIDGGHASLIGQTNTGPIKGDIVTAGAISDAVWEEAIADHTNAGTAGLAINAASGAPNAATIADAVWEEATADHANANTTGKALSDASVGGNAAAFADAIWESDITLHTNANTAGLALGSAGSAGDPWATTLPGNYANGTAGQVFGARIDAAISSVTNAVQVVASSVWEELTANHANANTTGAALTSAASGANSAAIADAVWEEATADHANTGTAGKVLAAAGATLNATQIETAVWEAARANHANNATFGEGVAGVYGNITGNVVGSTASVTGAVGSVTGSIGGNVNGNVVGSVASVTGNVGGSVVGSVASVAGNVGGNVNGGVIGAVGSVTSGVTLANDAITNAKFDESTAFPLMQADTGATAVLRTGNDSDTGETLSDQIDAIGGNIIFGPYNVAVRVTDGANTNLQTAHVRYHEGGDSSAGYTNANGIIVFSLDARVWGVEIAKSGYSFNSTTHNVTADNAPVYNMTVFAFTPSNVGLVTGYHYVRNENQAIEPGATVVCTMTAIPDDDVGVAYDSLARTITADNTGLAQYTNLVPGATYSFQRGADPAAGTFSRSSVESVTIPVNASSPYALPSILGADNS